MSASCLRLLGNMYLSPDQYTHRAQAGRKSPVVDPAVAHRAVDNDGCATLASTERGICET